MKILAEIPKPGPRPATGQRTVKWAREQVHLDVRGTMETCKRGMKTSEASIRALGWGLLQETSAGGAVRTTEDTSLGRLQVLVEADVRSCRMVVKELG